jgi:hypothetical protein
MRRRPGVAQICVAAVALCAGLGTGVAHAAPLTDVKDPFYRYDKPLDGVKPGTVLRTRIISVAPAGITTPIQATQVLYRTTKTNGAAVATVATVLHPLTPTNSPKILSYQTAYDDLGSSCTPSYELQGGNSPTVGVLEIGFMVAYLAQGYNVVTSDYEGLSHDYTAGQGAGYQTLDGIRAARTVLKLRSPTRVGMIGYSGGAIATEWAAELAPKYAPETSIVAAAAGGIPVDYAHILDYIDGSPAWASVMPYLLVGLARGYGTDLTPYLSPLGVKDVKSIGDTCLDTGAFPGLHMSDLLKPQYSEYRKLRPLAKLINTQIMGTGGTPHAALFLGAGNADGIGDGVMIASDVESLAHEYCGRGVPVTYREYPTMDHIVALVPFEAEALAFLTERFNGLPVQNGCGSIGPGNSLEALPLLPLPDLVVGKVRHDRHGFTVPVSISGDPATALRVSVYTKNAKGASKLLGSAKRSGVVGETARRLRVPLPHAAAGRRYYVTVRATYQTERVTGNTTYKAPR